MTPDGKQRVIVVPNGRAVSLGTYVRSWKAVKASPPDQQIRGWSWHAESAANILRDLHHGMHDRINKHDRAFGKGRKWSTEWQAETARAARQINSRVVIRWLPTWLRERFAHRIEQEAA